MKQLSGAVAVLTGASRGLGVAIAKELATNGVNLALAARSADELNEVRTQVQNMGVKAIAVPCDVTVAAQRAELLEQASAELGPVDVLVNNAGIETIASYARIDPAEIDHTIDVNLRAPMLLTRALIPQLLARGRGHVVKLPRPPARVALPTGHRIRQPSLVWWE